MWDYSVNGADMGLIQVPFSTLCVGDSSCHLRFDAKYVSPRSFLCFEGITYHATVLLNGVELGCMVPYSFYSFEITDLIRPENNDLIVKLQDMNLAFGPSEGWENYGGIIRDVYLEYTDTVRIEDVIWRTSLEKDHSFAHANVIISFSGGDGNVQAVVYDREGFEIVSAEAQTIEGQAVLQMQIERPQLWSPDFPYLYTLVVSTGDDSVIQKVGIKEFRSEGQRFLLNGKPLFLKGICRHDMWGDQGHTLTDEQMRKDMAMIKATGCNFVRLVHYPHNRRIVELADEIGLLVSEEPGLWWSDMHNPDTVAGALEVMERVVRRDRNRVSLAFWLCFNECIFTPEFLQQSSAVCRKLDPTRPVSGANCMSLEKTKEEFIKNGFDFYTMHPYGLELNHVGTRPNRAGTLDEILEVLNDKPVVFTEWGGLFVFENPKLFARFLTYMQDAWRKPDGDKVLAGCCYWVWADMYEFGRGEHACFDGILNEGLVDIYRNPRVNLDVFSKLMHGMDFARDEQQALVITPFNRHDACYLHPIDIWEGVDKKEQKATYEQLLKDATPQNGYYHKKERRLAHGPATPHEIRLLGNLPVNIPAGQPIVIHKETSFEINRKIDAVLFIGNVSMPYGYPAYGMHGETAAEYIFEYNDGEKVIVPIRNGIELTTALGQIGPSRINPVAAETTCAIQFSYDLNWEHYVVNLFEACANVQKTLAHMRIRITNPNYALVLYGITLKYA